MPQDVSEAASIACQKFKTDHYSQLQVIQIIIFHGKNTTFKKAG